MTSTRRSRRTVVAAAVSVALAGSGTAVAAAPPADRLVVRDVAGDANGLNDQGEGLVGNRTTSHQVDQADLREVVLGELTDASGRVEGLRLTIATTSQPGPLSDGTPLAYGVVLQPHPDCRFSIEHVTAGRSTTGQQLPATGLLLTSCHSGASERVPLRVVVDGSTATVDVPYSALPPSAQRTAEVGGAAAYVRTAPLRDLDHRLGDVRTVELDGAGAHQAYAFPG